MFITATINFPGTTQEVKITPMCPDCNHLTGDPDLNTAQCSSCKTTFTRTASHPVALFIPTKYQRDVKSSLPEPKNICSLWSTD